MTSPFSEELARLLSDIVFWGERVAQHIAGLSQEEFSRDISKCDSVCWCIVCIGEASSRIRQLYPEFAARNPTLELAKASAMRNRIAHVYAGIDVAVLWQAASVSVPALVAAARATTDGFEP